MRILLFCLLFIHGLIHLMGFVKGFRLAEVDALTVGVSKKWGIVWLLVAALCVLVAFLMLFNVEKWWLVGFLTLLLSQLVIIAFWQDAKFGTFVNLILLPVFLMSIGHASFEKLVFSEKENMIKSISATPLSEVQPQQLNRLPEPVQRWLEKTGVIGQPATRKVVLQQELQLKLKPEQQQWNTATATQYYTVEKPAFLWKMDMNMMGILPVTGRDKFVDGKGAMLIKLGGLINIVDASGNEKLNQAALQRYLSEMVWLPDMALQPYIQWTPLTANSARATLNWKGSSGSCDFFFDEEDRIVRVEAQRYKETTAEAETRPWIIEVQEFDTMGAYLIPVQATVSWELPEKRWTWLKIKVTAAIYT